MARGSPEAQIGGDGLACVLGFVIVSPVHRETAEAFRRTWISMAGYRPGEYGYDQAAALAVAATARGLWAALLLGFLGHRKWKAVRVVAWLDLLTAFQYPVVLLWAIPTAVLTLSNSTRQYCRARVVGGEAEARDNR
jgi:hypothetical protein